MSQKKNKTKERNNIPKKAKLKVIKKQIKETTKKNIEQ